MWPRALVALLGAWLMAAPAVLDYGGAAATSDRIAGPLVVTVAIVAMSRAVRGLRRVNTLAGAWIAIAPLFLNHAGAATLNALAVGLAMVALSLVGGSHEAEFDGGWRSLWRREAR